MKKYLTYQDDKSDKFWQIEVNGKSFTVTYGKTGTAGTAQTKKFDSEEKCLKEAEKLVSEKVKKGYVESKSDKANRRLIDADGSYINKWKEIVNSNDKVKALTEHFSYLADSPGFETLLKAIFKDTIGVEMYNNTLRIEISKGFFIASAPGNLASYKDYTPSFKKIIQKHEYIGFNLVKNITDVSNCKIQLGKCYFDFDIYDEGDEVYELFGGKEKAVKCVLHEEDKADWLYHPKQKNPQGEPALFPVVHELEDVVNIELFNIGSLFIKCVAESIGIDTENIINLPMENSQKDNFKLEFESNQEIPMYFFAITPIGNKQYLAAYHKKGEREKKVSYFGLLKYLNNKIEILSEVTSGNEYNNISKIKHSKNLAIGIGDSKSTLYIFNIDNKISVSRIIQSSEAQIQAADIVDNHIFYITNEKMYLLNTFNDSIREYNKVPDRIEDCRLCKNEVFIIGQHETFQFDLNEGKIKCKTKLANGTGTELVLFADNRLLVALDKMDIFGLFCVYDLGNKLDKKKFSELRKRTMIKYTQIDNVVWIIARNYKAKACSIVKVIAKQSDIKYTEQIIEKIDLEKYNPMLIDFDNNEAFIVCNYFVAPYDSSVLFY